MLGKLRSKSSNPEEEVKIVAPKQPVIAKVKVPEIKFKAEVIDEDLSRSSKKEFKAAGRDFDFNPLPREQSRDGLGKRRYQR
jgi:hypothetical protein